MNDLENKGKMIGKPLSMTYALEVGLQARDWLWLSHLLPTVLQETVFLWLGSGDWCPLIAVESALRIRISSNKQMDLHRVTESQALKNCFHSYSSLMWIKLCCYKLTLLWPIVFLFFSFFSICSLIKPVFFYKCYFILYEFVLCKW